MLGLQMCTTRPSASYISNYTVKSTEEAWHMMTLSLHRRMCREWKKLQLWRTSTLRMTWDSEMQNLGAMGQNL